MAWVARFLVVYMSSGGQGHVMVAPPRTVNWIDVRSNGGAVTTAQGNPPPPPTPPPSRMWPPPSPADGFPYRDDSDYDGDQG